MAGRSVSAMVTLAGGERLFVKHDRAGHADLFANEAGLLFMLQSCAEDALIFPELVEYSASAAILITKWLDGYVSIEQEALNRPRCMIRM